MSKANRQRRHQPRAARRSMLVLVTRIGHAEHVPAGYQTGDCYECLLPVWISPEVLTFGRRLGLDVAPLCDVCLKKKE
jgi:hypothetical protein